MQIGIQTAWAMGVVHKKMFKLLKCCLPIYDQTVAMQHKQYENIKNFISFRKIIGCYVLWLKVMGLLINPSYSLFSKTAGTINFRYERVN